jgi:peroxiredoxin
MGISTRSTALVAAAFVGSLAALCLVALEGCGNSGSGDPAASSQEGKPADSKASLPTASLGNPTSATAGQTEPPPTDAPANSQTAANPGGPAQSNADPQAIPKEGSPEWLLGQLLVLRTQPVPTGMTPQDNAARTEYNQKLVAASLELIEKTHAQKELEPIFNRAVQILCDARLELAMAGSADDIKALQDDAEAFYKRDPTSAAAEEAGWHLARLAHTNARQARNDRRKIQAFAIAARLFATRFPKSEAKALPMLAAAGQTCELYHLDAEAMNCFVMLEEKFPKTPQAEQATAILRRLDLKGKKVVLAGEMSDGGYLKKGKLLGRPVLVVFWSSDSESFQELLPELQKVLRPYERSGLRILGVCLDEEKAPMDAFIAKNGLNWTQLFYADPDKRHWDHPLAKYYGVHDLPSVWLVDQEGIAVDTHVTPESLDGQLRYLLANAGSSQRQ